MSWRKWMVRSLVFAVAGVMAAAALTYQYWTNPAVVRKQVIKSLEEHFPGAHVSLESARLGLLGGISFSELRLARRDDPSRTDFIYVPSGTIDLDKEQLLSGTLAIRRLVSYRPVLRLIRDAADAWNMAGMARSSSESAVPIIVLQQATLFVEDRKAHPDAPPLKLREANFVLMNDPHQPSAISLLSFKGTAVADLLGTVQVEGTMERLSSAFNAKLQAPSFTIDGALVQRLSTFCPEVGVQARQLTGSGTLQAEISYHPESERPWHHKVHWELAQGKFSHAMLPFPLENLQASVRCLDGQLTLEKLTARFGSAQVHLSGKALSLNLDTDILDGRLEVEHLPFSKELFEALPETCRDIEKEYAPQGAFTLAVDFSRRAGQVWKHGIIQLEDMTGVCARFPYRLEHISGTLEQEIDQSTSVDEVKVDLVGYTGLTPVFIQGEIKGKKPASVALQIRAKDVPIDDKLCAALQPEFQKLARSFDPRGYADIEVHLQRPQGERQFANHYILHFHDAVVTYELFPYPLERVSGTLAIQPDHWEYRDFQGAHKGGAFRSKGRSVHSPRGQGADIEIMGTGILLDPELRAALKRPALETAWQKLDPGGRMDFKARVQSLPGRNEPDIEVIVTPRGCTLKPAFFPYMLGDVYGTVHYRQHEVDLEKLSARHQSTLVHLERGKVFFNADGSFAVRLLNLLGDPILPDAEFVRALPPALGSACTSLQIQEPLSLLCSNLTVAVPADLRLPPRIDWDGGVRFKDAILRAGVALERVNGMIWCCGEHRDGTFGNVQGNIKLEQASVYHQTLRDLHSQILVDAKEPDFLVLPNLNAHLYGGDLGGSVRVRIGPSVSYEADLTALQIQLDEFSRVNRLAPNAQQSGPLNARLYLKGQGTDLTGLKGWGSIDVDNGKMYNLPILLDLLKFLSLRLPDRTFFEEAHARFTMDGPRVEISRIDLLGAAISFGGSGTVNLDNSSYNMDLYAVWARIVQLSPPLIKDIWPTVSKQLLKIKMNGKIGQTPHFEKQPVPGLIEPLEKVRERMAGKQSG
jgi:hypothetical protein